MTLCLRRCRAFRRPARPSSMILKSLPKAVLLWRSMLTAMGGIGIVMFAVALLPFLGIGGMQMFQRENSDLNDKFMPKFHYILPNGFFLVYLFFAFCAPFVCILRGWVGLMRLTTRCQRLRPPVFLLKTNQFSTLTM